MTATQERQTFAAQYQEEAKEILVLTADYHKGFMRTDDNILWQTSCDLIAWLEDGELRHAPFARLEWLVAETTAPDARLALFTNYRLRVRAHKDVPGLFMLLDVLQSDVAAPVLQAVREDWLRPVHWQEAPLPKFHLNKSAHCYQAEATIYGETVTLLLEQSEDSEAPAPAAVASLQNLYATRETRLPRLKEEIYAALPEAVQLWQQDKNSDAPSAATFRQHLHLQEISCEADGSITAWLYNDEHLAGHIIYACLNSDSSLAEAGLEG